MSFVKHKERIFLKKKQNAVRKRSDCNLRRISSCSDVRAWSMSAEERRQHFLDCVSSSSKSCFGKYVPPDIIVDILKKQNSIHLKKFSSLKRCSSEDLLKKKDRKDFTGKKSKLNLQSNETKNLGNGAEILRDNSELNNLRSMVKDLQCQLSVMKRLEDENSTLKAQISSGIKKIENFESMGVLDLKQCLPPTNCEQLSEAIDVIGNQCCKMRSSVDYLQTTNLKLNNKLKRSHSVERSLKNRQLHVSLETVNNAILQSKVSSKDNKIQKLLSINEEQKILIESLSCHIKDLSVNFSWKEEMLLGKLLEFKNLLKSSYDKTVLYENRLTLSQNVIQEMEILRNHFRMVNTALKEETHHYKNRLRTVACKALEMAGKIECLLREVTKRDAKIKELSKFPCRSAMAIRLTQLDHILHGDFLFSKNKDGVVETFERLKKILKDLKHDAWESFGLEQPISFSENSCQVLVDYNESCIQNSPEVSEIEVQTVFPDDYVVKYTVYIIYISLFNLIVRRMKLYTKKHELKSRDLQTQVDELMQALKMKDIDIESFNNSNKILQNNMDLLTKEINESRSSNANILKSSQCMIGVCESLNDLFYQTLFSTIKDFNSYCNILEEIVENNICKLNELSEYIETDLSEQRWQYFHYLSELERKNSLLLESLTKEANMNTALCREVDILIGDLNERDDFIYKLKDLWLTAEYEKSQLSEILITQKESFKVSSQIGIDLVDAESITDLEILVLQKRSLDKEVETEIELPFLKSKCFKKLVKNQWINDKTLKKQMSRVNVKIKRIRIRIINLKTKLELSIDSLNKMKESNILLTEVNRNVTSENQKLKNRNIKLQEIISRLRSDIKSESFKNDELQNNQLQFFNDFQRINTELSQLKVSSVKHLSENSINTDVTMVDFELLLRSKDECIEQLKERIEKLLELLREIEEEKLVKEGNGVCRYSQCDIYNDIEEKYQKLLNEVKENYESTITDMKLDFVEEKDTKEKFYRSNLSLLKDTYERDIKRIKIANAESLRKIQTFHEDEIREIKKSQEKVRTKTEQVDTSFIQEKHSFEIEQLRVSYEKNIKEKTDMFLKEKETLQEEIKKYMSEKESQVEEITKRMENGIKLMKKKCKQQMKKLQKENSCALDELRKQYSITKIDDVSSLDVSDVCSLSLDKDYSLVESEETSHVKDDFDHYFEANTDTSGFEEDHDECVMMDERRFLLKRIELLEDQLAEKQAKSSENACDSEKRVWLEKERCREISKLLDKEMERNEKLRAVLKEEKNRANHLQVINRALLDKIQNMELRNQDNVDTYRIFNKEQLSNISYKFV